MLSLVARIRSLLRGVRRGDALNDDMEAEFGLDHRRQRATRVHVEPSYRLGARYARNRWEYTAWPRSNKLYTACARFEYPVKTPRSQPVAGR